MTGASAAERYEPPNLTREEDAALQSYINDWEYWGAFLDAEDIADLRDDENESEAIFSTLNRRLRTGAHIPAGGRRLVAALDRATRSSRLTEPTTLYRRRHRLADLKVGDAVTDPGFVSTTFGGSEDDWFGPTLYEIHAPAGTPGVPADYVWDEWLLPRGLVYRVVSAKPRHVVLEIVRPKSKLTEAWEEAKHPRAKTTGKTNRGSFATKRASGASGADIANARTVKVWSQGRGENRQARQVVNHWASLVAGLARQTGTEFRLRDVQFSAAKEAEGSYGWYVQSTESAVIHMPHRSAVLESLSAGDPIDNSNVGVSLTTVVHELLHGVGPRRPEEGLHEEHNMNEALVEHAARALVDEHAVFAEGVRDAMWERLDAHPYARLVQILADSWPRGVEELDRVVSHLLTMEHNETISAYAGIAGINEEALRKRLRRGVLLGDVREARAQDEGDRIIEEFVESERRYGLRSPAALREAFNPDQPRGPDGRWIHVPGAGWIEIHGPAPSTDPALWQPWEAAVAVQDDHRRQGIASTLMRAAMQDGLRVLQTDHETFTPEGAELSRRLGREVPADAPPAGQPPSLWSLLHDARLIDEDGQFLPTENAKPGVSRERYYERGDIRLPRSDWWSYAYRNEDLVPVGALQVYAPFLWPQDLTEAARWLAEAWVENDHPRGPNGRWVAKVDRFNRAPTGDFPDSWEIGLIPSVPHDPHELGWFPGQRGKGWIFTDGRVETWNVDSGQQPYHDDYQKALELDDDAPWGAQAFMIDRDGSIALGLDGYFDFEGNYYEFDVPLSEVLRHLRAVCKEFRAPRRTSFTESAMKAAARLLEAPWRAGAPDPPWVRRDTGGRFSSWAAKGWDDNAPRFTARKMVDYLVDAVPEIADELDWDENDKPVLPEWWNPASHYRLMRVPLAGLYAEGTDDSEGRLEDYTAQYQRWTEPPPPILLSFDPDDPLEMSVVDGNHRVAALQRAGARDVEAFVPDTPGAKVWLEAEARGAAAAEPTQAVIDRANAILAEAWVENDHPRGSDGQWISKHLPPPWAFQLPARREDMHWSIEMDDVLADDVPFPGTIPDLDTFLPDAMAAAWEVLDRPAPGDHAAPPHTGPAGDIMLARFGLLIAEIELGRSTKHAAFVRWPDGSTSLVDTRQWHPKSRREYLTRYARQVDDMREGCWLWNSREANGERSDVELGRAVGMAVLSEGWDEQEHPRGKTSAESNSGSFATTRKRAHVAARMYGGRYSDHVKANRALRRREGPGKTSATVQRMIDGLDGAFTLPESAVTKPATVFRGMSFKTDAARHRFLKSLKIGEVFTDPGFTSATALQQEADFYRTHPDDRVDFRTPAAAGVGVAVEIGLPTGSRALRLADWVERSHQVRKGGSQEVLLPRGSAFRVVSVDGNQVTLELVPAQLLREAWVESDHPRGTGLRPREDGTLEVYDPASLLEAGWDETKHPRGPDGRWRRFYHVAPVERRDSIASDGLQPGRGRTWRDARETHPDAVYLWDTIENARFYVGELASRSNAELEYDVYEVTPPKGTVLEMDPYLRGKQDPDEQFWGAKPKPVMGPAWMLHGGLPAAAATKVESWKRNPYSDTDPTSWTMDDWRRWARERTMVSRATQQLPMYLVESLAGAARSIAEADLREAWDASQHPRGRSTPGTNSGSFVSRAEADDLAAAAAKEWALILARSPEKAAAERAQQRAASTAFREQVKAAGYKNRDRIRLKDRPGDFELFHHHYDGEKGVIVAAPENFGAPFETFDTTLDNIAGHSTSPSPAALRNPFNNVHPRYRGPMSVEGYHNGGYAGIAGVRREGFDFSKHKRGTWGIGAYVFAGNVRKGYNPGGPGEDSVPLRVELDNVLVASLAHPISHLDHDDPGQAEFDRITAGIRDGNKQREAMLAAGYDGMLILLWPAEPYVLVSYKSEAVKVIDHVGSDSGILAVGDEPPRPGEYRYQAGTDTLRARGLIEGDTLDDVDWPDDVPFPFGVEEAAMAVAASWLTVYARR